MEDVTRIFEAMEQGEPGAAERLLPLVYEELRRLAAARMAAEAPGQTLQPTALVHEAYLRLVGAGVERHWDGRGHFFAAAAEAMRRILVEAARNRRAIKRGGGWGRVDEALTGVTAPERPEELLAVDEALERLAEIDPQAAELVKLRYFVGLTVADAAKVLGLSTRSAERLWAFARAWLRRSIEGA